MDGQSNKNEKKDNADSNKTIPAGAASLMDLFQPPPLAVNNAKKDQTQVPVDSSTTSSSPPPPPPPRPPRTGSHSVWMPPSKRPDLERQRTTQRSNVSSSNVSTEQTALLREIWLNQSSTTPDTSPTKNKNSGSFKPPIHEAVTEKQKTRHRRLPSTDPLLTSIRESPQAKQQQSRFGPFVKKHLCPTTFVGSFMFCLYHVVFCLAMGSSILRPSTSASILGIMTKMTCVGIIFSSPCFIWRMGNDIPALYATADLFLAPFLAHLATVVDDALIKDKQNEQGDDNMSDEDDDDQVFFATFCVLAGIGFILSGTLLVLASKFKLANLGTFLPYSVLCGFFSAVGIMLWTLAFTVDTNGQQWQPVVMSGDSALVWKSLKHHLPSLFVGCFMKWLGPKNPFWVSVLVLATILSFYITMFVTGTSLEQAQEDEWFWSRDDLVYHSRKVHFGFDNWAPPAPFGVLNSLANGNVHWRAVREGMPTVCALSFLYLLRCSLHATALRKNIGNLVRIVPKSAAATATEIKRPTMFRRVSEKLINLASPMIMNKGSARHVRKFSEAVDLDLIIPDEVKEGDVVDTPEDEVEEIRAKTTKKTLQDILMEYAFSQYLVAAVGGFCVLPSIATAPTMYSIGAEGVAPQYGSVLLLLVFYLTNFQLVGYIPKAAFSCLIVLAALDMLITWFVKSFWKTREKAEWMVVPIIVIFAFVVGLLNAVFLGVATSTFIFVSSFFRTSVVKFAATGLSIRSTIERPVSDGSWLDSNGDLIQVLVLQNYLFFGNASSILTYIGTMFEEPDSIEAEKIDFPLPPKPKFLILDLTLVTGMDTSTVDVMSDIKGLCASQACKIFLAGLSPRIRSIMALGGVKQEKGERSKRQLRMFPDLDMALGKAEDILIQQEKENDHFRGSVSYQRGRFISEDDNGFRYALRLIDEQHGEDFADELVPLQKYTTVVELHRGDRLFDRDGEPLHVSERGLFFIEAGMMKIERDASETLTRGSVNSLRRRPSRNDLSVMNARTGSIGRQVAALKARTHDASRNMRLARIGPGWVVGAIEGLTGSKHTGRHIALTDCRLHHLPYSKIQGIEDKNPALVLRLYKMLTHLMVRRHEVAIEQLATLHSIMTSPAHSRPISRATQGALASINGSLS